MPCRMDGIASVITLLLQQDHCLLSNKGRICNNGRISNSQAHLKNFSVLKWVLRV